MIRKRLQHVSDTIMLKAGIAGAMSIHRACVRDLASHNGADRLSAALALPDSKAICQRVGERTKP
jgi:hypothetical protein